MIINTMQIQQKKSLLLLIDNQELLQKLPLCLSKHIETYENIHRDIDSSDHHPMAHYRNSQDNNESNLQQFINISTEFVDTVSRLKNNFTILGSRHGAHKTGAQQPSQSDKDKPRITNFEMFVSEHCENSAKSELKSTFEPTLSEEDFAQFEEDLSLPSHK